MVKTSFAAHQGCGHGTFDYIYFETSEIKVFTNQKSLVKKRKKFYDHSLILILMKFYAICKLWSLRKFCGSPEYLQRHTVWKHFPIFTKYFTRMFSRFFSSNLQELFKLISWTQQFFISNSWEPSPVSLWLLLWTSKSRSQPFNSLVIILTNLVTSS